VYSTNLDKLLFILKTIVRQCLLFSALMMAGSFVGYYPTKDDLFAWGLNERRVKI
jgi:hypothetical protein